MVLFAMIKKRVTEFRCVRTSNAERSELTMEREPLSLSWVPCLHTIDDKRNHLITSKEYLTLFNLNSDKILRWFVTVNKTWINHNTLEIRQQSVSRSESVPHEVKFLECTWYHRRIAPSSAKFSRLKSQWLFAVLKVEEIIGRNEIWLHRWNHRSKNRLIEVELKDLGSQNYQLLLHFFYIKI